MHFFYRQFFTLLIIFGPIFLAKAAVLKGKISDLNNDALPFASIYVSQSTYGVSSDLNGNYFLEIPKGSYEITYSFIGYESKKIKIDISQNITVLDVQLGESSHQLNELEIIADTREITRYIIQQTRSKRESYSALLKNIRCEVYQKSSLEKEEKPTDSLIKLNIKNLNDHLKKEHLNLIESNSIWHFQSKNTFKNEIIAFHDFAETKGETDAVSVGIQLENQSIVPKMGEEKNPYLILPDNLFSFNFYENLINIPSLFTKPLVSPIAFNSGIYYEFKLIESFYEAEAKIYKLQVSPRNKAEALFSGYIFIEDSSWSLKSVDLTLNKNGLLYCHDFRIIQNYEDHHPEQAPGRTELFYVIKEGQQKIIGNTRIHYKNYQFGVLFPSKFFRNEIKVYRDNAFDLDDKYWDSLRPISLQTNELEYIDKTDSIRAYYTSDAYYRELDSTFNERTIWTPFIGIGHRNRKKGTEWFVSGLLEQVNPFGIGGYRHKLPAYFKYNISDKYALETRGFIDYGFKNKDVKGKLGLGLNYNPKKFMRTFVEAGEFYEMINGYASVGQTFSRSNYAKTRTFNISQQMEIFNGLFAELTLDYSDQAAIDNLEQDNWSGHLFGSVNTPVTFERYTKSEIGLELAYFFRQKYVIKKGKKIILGSAYPSLDFKYRKGIPGLFKSEVNFDFFEVGAKHNVTLARWGTAAWKVSLGSFINKNNLRVLEYRYFRGSDKFLFSDPVRSFQLLGPTLNTPNEFLQANYMHHFNGAILHKIPLLARMKMSLAGGAGTLIIPDSKFAHFEMFGGLEKQIRIKKQLFKIGLYAVTADNSIENANFTWKIGINAYNNFTNGWSY